MADFIQGDGCKFNGRNELHQMSFVQSNGNGYGGVNAFLGKADKEASMGQLRKRRKKKIDDVTVHCGCLGNRISEYETKQHDELADFQCYCCQVKFCSHDFLLQHVCAGSGSVFECNSCFVDFESENELERHIESGTCKNGFRCDICRKQFEVLSMLEQHITAHFMGVNTCKCCNESFYSLTDLDKHLVSCKCNVLVCEFCNKKFLHLDKLKIHLLKHKNMSYECFKCLVPLKTRKCLEAHKCDGTFRCSHCGKMYKSRNALDKHLRGHLLSSLKCEKCKRSFVNVANFSKHKCKFVKPRQTRSFECDDCGEKFARLVKLEIHILSIHHGINYHCEKCGDKFPSKETQDDHIAKGKCKSDDPIVCQICGKMFLKRDYLKKHEYMHKGGVYKCKFCYCPFMKEKSFQRHVEKLNCSKSARKVQLSKYNFKLCRYCNIEFEEESTLIEHFKVKHETEKPHQCFCCSMQLYTYQELQQHIHEHDVQKYTCKDCGKPYTSQEGFRKHRLKHKISKYKCVYCEAEFLNENRYRFHERTCRKNPTGVYDPQLKVRKKNPARAKQSRQLHWESRIIMKRLREDPTVVEDVTPTWNECFIIEADDNSASERGWFDNYYKTEEDDLTFGVSNKPASQNMDYESDFDVNEFLQSGSIVKKSKTNVETQTEQDFESNDFEGNDDADSLPDAVTETDSEEEEDIEDIKMPCGYNPKNCRICHLTFPQEYELLHHFIKQHTGEMAHRCPSCAADFPLFAQLKEHMKVHGIGMGVFNCDNCSKKFKSEKKMKSHNIRCKGVEPGSSNHNSEDSCDYCKHCGKKFQTKCGYKRHKMNCKKKKKVPRSVKKQTVVEKWEEVEEDLREDEESEHEDVKKEEESKEEVKTDEAEQEKVFYPREPPLDSFPCRLCDKKFQYERGLVMHFKNLHPGQKPLVCNVCNMQLADKLKEHLKTHGIGEEFICELCGKRFNQKFLSKIHEMWHQGIEFKCNNCKQKFLNKEKMDKHISENRCSNRQSLMRLPCDICGKSYRSKFGLNKHHMTHMPKELRPIKNMMNCEFCGKWFESNNGLQRHRRIHTGERPYCCRFCPKAFAQEGNCKAHERIHTGETRPRKKNSKQVNDLVQETVELSDPVYTYPPYLAPA